LGTIIGQNLEYWKKYRMSVRKGLK